MCRTFQSTSSDGNHTVLLRYTILFFLKLNKDILMLPQSLYTDEDNLALGEKIAPVPYVVELRMLLYEEILEDMRLD